MNNNFFYCFLESVAVIIPSSLHVHVLKVVTIVISVQFNLSTILVVSHFLSAKVSTEWV